MKNYNCIAILFDIIISMVIVWIVLFGGDQNKENVTDFV